jgi:hypothetical protein
LWRHFVINVCHWTWSLPNYMWRHFVINVCHWTWSLPNYIQLFSLDLTWYDFIIQKQVYHIFVDETTYYLHKPCMKTKGYLQIHNLTIRVYIIIVFFMSCQTNIIDNLGISHCNKLIYCILLSLYIITCSRGSKLKQVEGGQKNNYFHNFVWNNSGDKIGLASPRQLLRILEH